MISMELMHKAAIAVQSPKLLLDAGDLDGACNRDLGKKLGGTAPERQHVRADWIEGCEQSGNAIDVVVLSDRRPGRPYGTRDRNDCETAA